MATPKRIDDLAKEFGVNPITIRREIERGNLPYHKIGRLYLFTEQDIATYLERIAGGKAC